MRIPARAGLAFALALSLATGTAQAGLIVRQSSNGLPGQAQEQVTRQTLLVGERALRVDDRGGGRYTVVRLDDEKILEIDPDQGEYTERTFASLRRKRAEAESERREQWKTIIDHFQGAERAAQLKKHNLREDGRDVVTVESAPGDDILGHHTRRTSILVNDAPAIVVYATDEIREYRPPRVLFEFYEKSGLFPDGVVAALKKVEGFPLRLYARVDFYDAATEIRTQVETVADWPEDPRVFAIPEKCRLVERFTDPAAAAQELRCAVCGKPIPRGREIRVPGENVWVDSQDHLVEYVTTKKHRK
jgi:hypothetical protein